DRLGQARVPDHREQQPRRGPDRLRPRRRRRPGCPRHPRPHQPARHAHRLDRRARRPRRPVRDPRNQAGRVTPPASRPTAWPPSPRPTGPVLAGPAGRRCARSAPAPPSPAPAPAWPGPTASPRPSHPPGTGPTRSPAAVAASMCRGARSTAARSPSDTASDAAPWPSAGSFGRILAHAPAGSLSGAPPSGSGRALQPPGRGREPSPWAHVAPGTPRRGPAMRIRTAAAAVLIPAALAAAEVVTLVPVRDNTLYDDSTGATSNGAGPGFFVGAN